MAKNTSGNYTISLSKVDRIRLAQVAKFSGMSKESTIRELIRSAHKDMQGIIAQSRIGGVEADSDQEIIGDDEGHP